MSTNTEWFITRFVVLVVSVWLVVLCARVLREGARVSADSECRKFGFDAATYPKDDYFSVIHCEAFETGQLMPIGQARKRYHCQ